MEWGRWKIGVGEPQVERERATNNEILSLFLHTSGEYCCYLSDSIAP